MKKTIFLALALCATQSFAATITWGFGADVYLMKQGETYSDAVLASKYTGTIPAGAYLALVYVGQGTDSLEIDSISSSSEVDKMAYDVEGGEGYCDWKPFSQDITVGASTYADGASFSVVWFNGSSYDYVYSMDDGAAIKDTYTISDMTRGSAQINFASETTSYAGVIAVPEPSTAALALAGLALLLKRRKA